MKGQLQEIKKEVTLKDKLHLMAETLRNCNLNQGVYDFCTKNKDGKESFCVYGALGFMAGIPKDDLQFNPYIPILRKYGITEDKESEMLVEVPQFHQYAERQMPLCNALWYMNDHGTSFNKVADWLDNIKV